MKTGFARALNEIIHDGVATPREMAGPDAADCSVSHLRDVANLKCTKELSPEKRERLSRWLIRERGEVRQLQGLLGKEGGAYVRSDQVALDECLKDEMAEIQKELTYADDAMKNGEFDAARRHRAKARGVVEMALEEIEAAEAMHQSTEHGTITAHRSQ
jgi:hypothetical protein